MSPWQASLSLIDLTWPPQTKIRIVLAIDQNSWQSPLPRAGTGDWSSDEEEK